jgi:hypothetical protein
MTAEAPWKAIEGALHGALVTAGFALIGATTSRAYHDALSDRERFALPELGGPDRLLLCVGNTRTLWPELKAAVQSTPELGATAHPVDDFARAVVGRAAAEVAAAFGVRHLARYAGDTGDRPAERCAGATRPTPIDIVRLAEIAGLGHRSPSRLLVHPSHGPWIGLRAAVLFDVEGPIEAPRRAPSPCEACAERPCVGAYEAAVAASGGEQGVTQASLERDYPLWLAVRTVCPVGRASRYDDDQAEYHYTKRRGLLGRGADA